MPTTYSYPGVYVEEIPSGVRTIVGVSTSNTAFVDFFKRGPLNQPVRITSLGDFEREFGGLDPRSEASYAIQQFFLNGGSTAWVVRVASNAQAAERTLPVGASYYGSGEISGGMSGGAPSGSGGTTGNLRVTAISEGEWGNHLQVGIQPVLAAGGTLTGDFNLEVREIIQVKGKDQVTRSEVFRNLNLDQTSARYAEAVVNNGSSLIRLKAEALGGMPVSTDTKLPDSGDPEGFRWLGRGTGQQMGSDGTLPTADQWKQGEGAVALRGSPLDKTGLYALERIAPDIFNLLCLPAAANLADGWLTQVLSDATAFCIAQRAFLIVDIPPSVQTQKQMEDWMEAHDTLRSNYAAIYFPRFEMPDPLNEFRPRNVGASGTLAGIFARTDSSRGVWKAPAGVESNLRGANLSLKLTDAENGFLNQKGINVARNFPIYGNISWGARTLEGADQQASEWKYIPVRRTALFIEESLYQGLKWVVFEPNDEPLWAQIRLNVGAFMQNLFRQGAFQGKSPRDAYFVKCDRETTTQNDINLGIVNILIGFAPLKPAEFVVVKLHQMSGQIET
jgi:phage tail sheath protein FI